MGCSIDQSIAPPVARPISGRLNALLGHRELRALPKLFLVRRQ
jgi:hypothetical protein